MAYKLKSAGPITEAENNRIVEKRKQRDDQIRRHEKLRQATIKRYDLLRKKYKIPNYKDDPAVQASKAAIAGSERALAELRGELAKCNSELSNISAAGGAKGMIGRAVELETRLHGVAKAITTAETRLRKAQGDFDVEVNAAKNVESRRWQQVSDDLTALQIAPLERYLELEATKKDIRAIAAFAGWLADKDLNPSACLSAIKHYLNGRG